MINFILWLLFGSFTGWLASLIMRTDAQQGALLNIIVGIVGAFIGGFVFGILGIGGSNINNNDFSLSALLVSFIGAVMLLAVVNLFRRGRVRGSEPRIRANPTPSVSDAQNSASNPSYSVQQERLAPKAPDLRQKPEPQSSKLRQLRTNQPAASTPSVAEAPRPAAPNIRSQAIFISYRREDAADIAGRIYDRLALHFSRDTVFKDVDSIPLGVDFRKHLLSTIDQCSVLLAVIGRQWLTATDSSGRPRLDNPDDFVRIELEGGLQREIMVVPLLVQGTTMPPLDKLPASLRGLVYRNAATIRPDPDFHRDMNRLIQAIENQLQPQKGKT